MLFSGGIELLVGNKNLTRRKSIWEGIFPGEEEEQFLGWWGNSQSRENPVIHNIKAKKKNSFYNLDNFKS